MNPLQGNINPPAESSFTLQQKLKKRASESDHTYTGHMLMVKPKIHALWSKPVRNTPPPVPLGSSLKA